MPPLLVIVSLLWVGSVVVVLVFDFKRLDELGVKGNEWHPKAPKHLAIASHILPLRLFLRFPRRPFHFQNGFVNCTNQSFAHERMLIKICLSVNEHVKGAVRTGIALLEFPNNHYLN
jgi:hypothetical protein